MNFDESPEETAYRGKVRAWIAANTPDLSVLSPGERRQWHPAHKDIARIWQACQRNRRAAVDGAAAETRSDRT
jgi:hypothetical protein